MKYDSQIIGLKNLLPSAKSVLITISAGADIDKLAAGLSLYLSLTQQGKEVTIICEDTLRVGQAHLFAIDRIKQALPSTGTIGNLVLSLEGVEMMEENGRLSPKALEKLDWYSEKNGTLNLIFHVLPGQNFQPTKIVPRYQGSSFDLVFVLGVSALQNLGNIYQQNQQLFSNGQVVNIDNQSGNSGFGQTNVVDPTASSISEIVTFLMPDLGLFIDGDIATNLLAGLFEATSNLINEKAGSDTFAAVSNCLRAGGKKPQTQASVQPTGGFDLSAFMPQNQNPAPTVANFPQIPVNNNLPVMTPDQFIPQAQPVQPITMQTAPPIQNSFNIPSAEERPVGESLSSESSEIEPDWLTPKVFKGSSIG